MPRRGDAEAGVPEDWRCACGREQRRRARRELTGRKARRGRQRRAGRRRTPQERAPQGQTCGGPRACRRSRGCPTSRRTSGRRRCAPGSSSAGPGGRICPNEEPSRAPTDTPYPPFPYVMVRYFSHAAHAARRRSHRDASTRPYRFAGDSDYRRIQMYSSLLKRCKKISVRPDEQFGPRRDKNRASLGDGGSAGKGSRAGKPATAHGLQMSETYGSAGAGFAGAGRREAGGKGLTCGLSRRLPRRRRSLRPFPPPRGRLRPSYRPRPSSAVRGARGSEAPRGRLCTEERRLPENRSRVNGRHRGPGIRAAEATRSTCVNDGHGPRWAPGGGLGARAGRSLGPILQANRGLRHRLACNAVRGANRQPDRGRRGPNRKNAHRSRQELGARLNREADRLQSAFEVLQPGNKNLFPIGDKVRFDFPKVFHGNLRLVVVKKYPARIDPKLRGVLLRPSFAHMDMRL